MQQSGISNPTVEAIYSTASAGRRDRAADLPGGPGQDRRDADLKPNSQVVFIDQLFNSKFRGLAANASLFGQLHPAFFWGNAYYSPNANWASFKSDEYSQLADGLLKETDPAEAEAGLRALGGLHPGPVVGAAVLQHRAARGDDHQSAGHGVQHDRVPDGQRRLADQLEQMKGWSVFRNVGSDAEHRAALERYVSVGHEHGYALSGSNFMVERFIFIGESERAAQLNFERTCVNFGRFQKSLSGNGRFTLPPSVQSSDGQQPAASAPVGPPPDAVVTGTPDQVAAALEQTLVSTGARRLMVETFSGDEMRLFAREVMPRVRRMTPIPQAIA